MIVQQAQIQEIKVRRKRGMFKKALEILIHSIIFIPAAPGKERLMGINTKAALWLLLASFVWIEPMAIFARTSSDPNSFATETKQEKDARMQWWREARFGMFIHYGPVSLTGKEISWSRANSNPKCPNKGETPVEVYDNLYKQFNPTSFNAAEWVDVAKAAGMKYVVLTAKHCDGFLLWDSKVDGYNITATPFKRDLCAELAQAVRNEGLKLGWYFSPMDWRDPDFRTDRNDTFVVRMQGELRELLSNYGKIDLLFFDYDGREAVFDQANTYRMVKELQPQIIINNRLDLGVNQHNTLMLNPNADYYTPEQRIGDYDDQRPWETNMTICRQWSWKPDDEMKSLKECIQTLIRCAGGDGNLLFNVGPMPDGRIEPRQVERLREMGEWLAKYGESIYSTRGGPFKPGDWGVSTHKGSTIYVHVLKWPENNVVLPPTSQKIIKSGCLTGGDVNVSQTDSGIEIFLPPSDRNAIDSIIVLELNQK